MTEEFNIIGSLVYSLVISGICTAKHQIVLVLIIIGTKIIVQVGDPGAQGPPVSTTNYSSILKQHYSCIYIQY